jgi:hypothetical protein
VFWKKDPQSSSMLQMTEYFIICSKLFVICSDEGLEQRLRPPGDGWGHLVPPRTRNGWDPRGAKS